MIHTQDQKKNTVLGGWRMQEKVYDPKPRGLILLLDLIITGSGASDQFLEL
jgi:hypothetical protein